MLNSVRTIAVFESRSRWEPELQRQFQNESVRVRGCRTWNELSLLVVPPIADVVVLELPEDLANCLQWLSKLVATHQAPPIVVLASAEFADVEWTLRDAGVRDVLMGDFSVERLAQICRRLAFTSDRQP